MTIMSVHSNVLTSIRSQLKLVLHSIVFRRLSFGSSITKILTKRVHRSYETGSHGVPIFMSKILQQFAENAYRNKLLIYYTTFF